MISEFDLINKYFSRPTPSVLLGVGDDCALLKLPKDQVLATSTDTLLQDVHFFSNTNPYNLGHKSLAVNLSDLAAMGATPKACLLNLALPSINQTWLADFSEGFYQLSNSTGCPLIGGDTTRSQSGLMITVTVMGAVNYENALKRNAALIGDDIWLTGSLGAPYVALMILQNHLNEYSDLLNTLLPFLEKPVPPNKFATELCGFANAAIDISDGLLQDLGHVIAASGCGAEICYDSLPIHNALIDFPIGLQQQAALSGGDVYQLCFTARPEYANVIMQLANSNNIQVSKIGKICLETGLKVLTASKDTLNLNNFGYDHFR